tara:strand:+ start:153 stop:422 length:270 start_codon:yes stop_codon:yes gene_type:complete
VAVLPDGATFEEFTQYVLERRGQVPLQELEELYERRLRLKSVTIARGETMRKMLPPEDRDLTMKEREKKLISEARAGGHEPVYQGRRWV